MKLVINEIPVGGRLDALAAEVRQLHGDVQEGLRLTLPKAIRIGDLLTEARTKVPHGRWLKRDGFKFTGDPIRFNKLGDLMDAGHRLEACILADKPIRSLVIWGLEPEVFDVIDTGAPRSGSDILTHEHYENTKILAAITKMLLAQARGANIFASDATNDEIKVYVAEFPEIITATKAAVKSQSVFRKKLAPGLAGYCYGNMHRIDPTLAAAFWETLRTGERLDIDDPIHVLRNKLLTQPEKKGLYREHKLAIIIKAWNATRRGERIKRLHWTPDEEMPIFE